MRRLSLTAMVLLVAAGCTTTKKSTLPAPPPGKSMDEYLAGPAKKPLTKPANTNDADAMKIHFIDVGQGSAHLLEFPCGAALIDAGGELNDLFDSRKALISYLDAFFARRTDLDKTLELLVISHPDVDHTRWVLEVITRYKVRNVIDNGMEKNDLGGRPQIGLHEWIKEQKGKVGYRAIKTNEIGAASGLTSAVIDPIHGCNRAATDPRIRVLWGQVMENRESFGENANDHSVVVRVDYGKSSALFPGDIEKAGIARISSKYSKHKRMLDTDIYQVAHHGSKRSTAQHLIEWVSPEIAVCSMGAYERDVPWTARKYGHPTAVSIDHLTHDKHGVRRQRSPIEVQVGLKGAWKKRKSVWEKRTIKHAIYGTGWEGHVVVTANANGWIEVSTSKQAPKPEAKPAATSAAPAAPSPR